MKKIVSGFFILAFFSFFLCAQVSVDPRNEFYSDAIGWELKGYIKNLPQLKPYPVNVIEKILEAVIENGEPSEKECARKYYNIYFGKKWHAALDGEYKVKLYSLEDTENDNAKRFEFSQVFSPELSFGTDLKLNDYTGIGFNAGLRTIINNDDICDVLPKYVSISDFEVPSFFKFEKGDTAFLPDLNGIVTFGNDKLYGFAGYNRIGYGIFPSTDLYLNPNADQMINFALNYEGEAFKYVQMFSLIGARHVYETDSFTMNKYLGFHSLNIPLFERKLDVSLVESVVFGNHFTPDYFIPVPWFIISNVSGEVENVFSGVKLVYKPLPCIALNFESLFDSFNYKKLLKLKLEDAAIRTAMSAGIAYTPFDSICKLITCDFTLVTPYSYTSFDSSSKTYNYTDYTNFGKEIGCELLPNSDRVVLSLKFNPVKQLTIVTSSSYMRHANQYEDLEPEEVINSQLYATDGSLYQTTQKIESSEDSTNFLTQEHKMYIMQAGIDFSYSLLLKKTSQVSVTGGYTFEYIENDGVDKSIYSGTYSDETEVLADKKIWIDNLHNSYNHYFRIGVKIIY